MFFQDFFTLTKLFNHHLEIGFTIGSSTSVDSPFNTAFGWCALRWPGHGSGASPKTTPPKALPTLFQGWNYMKPQKMGKKTRTVGEKQIFSCQKPWKHWFLLKPVCFVEFRRLIRPIHRMILWFWPWLQQPAQALDHCWSTRAANWRGSLPLSKTWFNETVNSGPS